MPSSNFFHNEKPLFHSTKSTLEGITLFLDFNKKDILQGLYYVSENETSWMESLEVYAKELEGKSFEELQSNYQGFTPKELSFFDLPHFLLKEALEEYRGKAPALHHIKKESEEELICRCFGIYREEILDFLKENPDLKNSDITNATKAGAGCASCLDDFQELIAEARSRKAKELLDK